MKLSDVSQAMAAAGQDHVLVLATVKGKNGVTYPASTITRLKPDAKTIPEMQRADFRLKPREGDAVLLRDGNTVFHARLSTWGQGPTASVWIPAIKSGKPYEELVMTLKNSIYQADQGV